MSDSRFDFGGKVALVTGVGRAGQIGNAVALAFGQAGAKIVACDLNAVGVAERVREFAALGVDARPCAGDLTQRDIAALAVEMALRHFGRLDVVVNVAGGLTTYGPIDKLVGCRLRPRARDQPQDDRAGVPGRRGGAESHRRVHRQLRLDRLLQAAGTHGGLQRRQGGGGRVHPEPRARAARPQSAGQRGGARHGPHRRQRRRHGRERGVRRAARYHRRGHVAGGAESSGITGHILPIAPAASGGA